MLIRDITNELHREINIRKGVFPRLIREGRLTQGESDERMDRLHAATGILNTLVKLGCVCPDDVTSLAEATPPGLIQCGVQSTPIHIKGGE